MNIPKWAEEYFIVQNDILHFKFSSLEPDLMKDRRYFRDVKELFKERLSSMEAYNPYPTSTLEECAMTYLLCNLGLGYMDYKLKILRGNSTSTRLTLDTKSIFRIF